MVSGHIQNSFLMIENLIIVQNSSNPLKNESGVWFWVFSFGTGCPRRKHNGQFFTIPVKLFQVSEAFITPK